MAKSGEILVGGLVVSCLLGWVDSFPIYFGIPIIFVIFYEWIFVQNSAKKLQYLFLCYLTADYFFRASTSIGNYFLLAAYVMSLNIRPKTEINVRAIIYIVLLVNLIVLSMFPGATQLLNFPDEFVYKGFPGWVKYALSNTVPLFIMSLFALKSGDNRLRLLMLTTLIIASKTTAIVLFILFWTITFLNAKTLIRGLFLVMISIFVVHYIISIPEYVLLRLSALVNLDLDSEYFIRIKLGLNSFITFLNSPLIGIGYFRMGFDGIYDLLHSPIGHHSHFIDSLGRFGLFSLLFIGIEYKRWRSQNLVVIVLLWMLLNNVVSFVWLLAPYIFKFNSK